MTTADLRNRLAEVLAMPTDTLSEIFDCGTAMAHLCRDPALASALEDAERVPALEAELASARNLLADWLKFASDVRPGCAAGEDWLDSLRARTNKATK